jgi:hypothetical protein
MFMPMDMNMATELAIAITRVRENPDIPLQFPGCGFMLYWHPEQKSPYHFLGRQIMIVSPVTAQQSTEPDSEHADKVMAIGQALCSIGERLAETYAYYFNGTDGFYEIMLDANGFCFHK